MTSLGLREYLKKTLRVGGHLVISSSTGETEVVRKYKILKLYPHFVLCERNGTRTCFLNIDVYNSLQGINLARETKIHR